MGANPNFDQIASTTLAHYQKQFGDNISKQIPFLYLMENKGGVKITGGEKIVRPLITAENSTVSSYSGSDIISTANQDAAFSAAEYNWKQVAGTVVNTGIERAQNMGPEKVLDLMQGKIDQLEISMRNGISSMLFSDGTGNSGKNILGLEALVDTDPTTGTLGGINRATNTFWRNKTNTSVGSFATGGLTAMGTMVRQLTRGTDRPDIIVTNRTIFGYLENVANGRAEFLNPKLAELGFEALKFQGIDVVYDEYCPDDRIYIINSKYMKFYMHQDFMYKMTKFVEPANQDISVAKCLFYGQVTTNRAESAGVLSGISA